MGGEGPPTSDLSDGGGAVGERSTRAAGSTAGSPHFAVSRRQSGQSIAAERVAAAGFRDPASDGTGGAPRSTLLRRAVSHPSRVSRALPTLTATGATDATLRLARRSRIVVFVAGIPRPLLLLASARSTGETASCLAR